MKHRFWMLLTIALLLAVWLIIPAAAQEDQPQLILSLRRDFGYGGAGEIEGSFSLIASGPDNLQRVVFLMDGEPMGETTAAPWQIRFHTSSFPPGSRRMSAIGYTAGGSELPSNVLQTRFLTSEQAGAATTRLIVTLLGGIGALMLVSFLITSYLSRGKRRTGVAAGAPRSYGLAGGAVCSRCGRPFARHIWAPNMVLGKLERCPHCGKVAIVRAASPAELAAAEAAELKAASPAKEAAPASPQDQLQRDIDNSRYLDT